MNAFLNSMIRQLGRDSGRVITNKVFGDAHAAPVRVIRSGQTPPRVHPVFLVKSAKASLKSLTML